MTRFVPIRLLCGTELHPLLNIINMLDLNFSVRILRYKKRRHQRMEEEIQKLEARAHKIMNVDQEMYFTVIDGKVSIVILNTLSCSSCSICGTNLRK